MTEEQKKACYQSYLEDLIYEYGTSKGAETYKEFCEEWDGCWDSFF